MGIIPKKKPPKKTTCQLLDQAMYSLNTMSKREHCRAGGTDFTLMYPTGPTQSPNCHSIMQVKNTVKWLKSIHCKPRKKR